MRDHDISQRRACVLIGVDPKTVRRERSPDNPEIREEMHKIAEQRRRFGYRRVGIMLERKGMVMNEKKLYRIYREEGLSVRRRRGRKRACGTRTPMPPALMPNQRWSLDFVADTFGASRKFRILAVIDDCCRENLCLIADTSLSGARVARELDALVRIYGKPVCIVSDNVLARERNAALGVRSRGIRATGYLLDGCPGGLHRQEVVSPIANTGSVWLPPSPSSRRDPTSQAEGPNIIYEVRKLPPRLYREGSFRLGSSPRRRDDRVRRI